MLHLVGLISLLESMMLGTTNIKLIIKFPLHSFQWAGDRIPVEARFSAHVETGPGAHPASCTMSTGTFPEGKEQPGRDADLSPPSSAVVKKE